MKENRLRNLLQEGKPTVGTRMWSTLPFFTEAVGATGLYDYIEFVAEYAPFTLYDLDNLCMACELHGMGSMIKLDYQNRGYFAQKAIQSGFQSVMFTDCRNADEVRESLKMITPETEQDGGTFGYANRRYIGFQPRIIQTAHAQRQRDIVVSLMIEKKAAIDNIEDICSVPGVDMVQFGPSDYSLSRGWDAKDHDDETKEAERHMIKTALAHGVRPRCEIQNPQDAQYYMNLGVRDFCMGDQMWKLMASWSRDGEAIRNLIKSL
ncbi:MAG: aldolase/citrate lyase family protein [Sphaerochaeta sp.]|jgi:2-keto-3-deoxy-L-rhamnonate aldolase RhmA|nr:aldolase/citrate lyase family protein [Sphaerochaeta sp.]